MGNRIQKLLDKYPNSDQDEILISKLGKIKEKKLTDEELELWYSTRGTLDFNAGNFKQAKMIFEEGIKHFPESGNLNFNLGSTLENLGQFQSVISHFKKVKTDSIIPQGLLHVAKVFYLWSEYEDGLAIIRSIFTAYYEFGTVDDNFLYMRGFPFYSETFGYLAVFAKLLNKNYLAREELEKAKKNFIQDDFSSLDTNLAAFVTNDWTSILNNIDSSLKNEELDAIHGMSIVLRALIISRKASSYEDSIKILDNTNLPEDSFSWLPDVLLLAKAEIANKYNNIDDENHYLNQFWENQPSLLEPNHVYTFGLDEYQEKLKKIFIARSKA